MSGITVSQSLRFFRRLWGAPGFPERFKPLIPPELDSPSPLVRRENRMLRQSVALSGALVALGLWSTPTQAQPYAFITNGGDSTISVIDTQTNDVIRTLEPEAGVGWVTVTPNGRWAYVGSNGSGDLDRVLEIDTSTLEVSRVLALEDALQEPTGLTVHPDGKRLYLGSLETLFEIDLNTFTISRRLVLPFFWIAALDVSPDGTKLFTANTIDDSVSIVDVESFTFIDHIPIGGHADHGRDRARRSTGLRDKRDLRRSLDPGCRGRHAYRSILLAVRGPGHCNR